MCVCADRVVGRRARRPVRQHALHHHQVQQAVHDGTRARDRLHLHVYLYSYNVLPTSTSVPALETRAQRALVCAGATESADARAIHVEGARNGHVSAAPGRGHPPHLHQLLQGSCSSGL